MKAIAIIPARFASTRFPGKMLADRTGKPLIQHVVEQAQQASLVSRVVVATDDSHIAEAVAVFGGQYIMTRLDHLNGTSRIAEAIEKLKAAGKLSEADSQMVVNVQGDEPEIDPDLIDLAIKTLAEQHNSPDIVASTLAAPFDSTEDAGNPNIVKVVCDQRGRALYFSRAAIPFDRDGSAATRPLKHIGLYVYRAGFLREYSALASTPLELSEKLEQLRILEHGRSIAVAIAPRPHAGCGIDTPEQYHAFVLRHTGRAAR